MTILAEKRVVRGTAWLDKEIPDWFERATVRSFDITDPCRCVLGQVFKKVCVENLKTKVVTDEEGWLPIDGFNYAITADVISSHKAVTHGFDVDVKVDWDDLQPLWLNEIKTRKAAAKAAA